MSGLRRRGHLGDDFLEPQLQPVHELPSRQQLHALECGSRCHHRLRVNSANGKVYLTNFGGGSEPAEIIELDPNTNLVRKWPTGNRPDHLVLDGRFVWATAVAGGPYPKDQILRLDTTTGSIRRWNVPGTGNFSSSPVPFEGLSNSITRDNDGNIWLTESTSNEIGRLHLAGTGDVIDEFTKPGMIAEPHAISSSGAGASLQVFFTEANGQQVSVLTPGVASRNVSACSLALPASMKSLRQA